MPRIGSTYPGTASQIFSVTSDAYGNTISAGIDPGGTLDSVEVFCNDAGVGDHIRVGLYSGGVSDGDADTASLIWDSGDTDIEGATAEWFTLTAGSEVIPASTRLWLFIKGQGSAQRYRTPEAENGDWLDQTRTQGTDGIPANAFEDPIAQTSPSATGYSLMMVINYTEAAGAAPFLPIHDRHENTLLRM